MATPFDVFFEQFLLIIDDSRFVTNYTPNELAMELSKYLYRSIGICGDYLYIDLNSYTPTTVDDNDILSIGEFADSFIMQEITFVARGMVIPYLEFQLQKNKHLNQIVYGKNYLVHSQANHIKENRETVNNAKNSLIQDMIMYTYHKDPNNLQGSSGGSI